MRGLETVAGVDEAGRGPLAGPVVAAAVVFAQASAEKAFEGALAALTDSKQLSPSRRESFFSVLEQWPDTHIGVGVADVEEIDRLNILRATHLAMRRAVEALPRLPGWILLDGRPVKDLPVPSTAIVRGDSSSFSIAAASVIAKVTRDRMMLDADRRFPCYGFARHKGYGTAQHMQALLERGPSPVHRRSFRPVREAEDIRLRRQAHVDAP